jgi:protein phosphatase
MKILIISDIHGNSVALRTVLEDAKRWDYVWVLGDLVDYGPEPHIVIDIVRELKPDVIVMGNHDYAVAFNTDCRCDPEIHELSEYTRRNISYRLLSREQIEWLKSLPIKIEKNVNGRKIYIVHGSPRNPLYGYLKPDLSKDEILLQITPSIYAVKPRPVNADIVLVGHTHIPTTILVDDRYILNPGSCGQPRDGDLRASYAIYDIEKGVFEIRRVKYDIGKVVEKLKNLNLEERYLKWLENILIIASIHRT